MTFAHILFLSPLSMQFHYEKMHAQFFVDNPDIAFELKNISDKIWDESNNKVCVKSVTVKNCKPGSISRMIPGHLSSHCQTKLSFVLRRSQSSSAPVMNPTW